MATIAEMNANMTIIYYKSNGDIYTLGSGIQPISTIFGNHSTDMALILDEIIIPKDEYVLKNKKLFKVDISKSPVVLALIPVALVENDYPVATS